jgi:hypothetical protein
MAKPHPTGNEHILSLLHKLISAHQKLQFSHTNDLILERIKADIDRAVLAARKARTKKLEGIGGLTQPRQIRLMA